MFSKGHRSGSKSDSRSKARRSRTPASDGSAVTSTPSGHPSTSVGRTSSTRLTSPSDTLMDFDPTPPQNQQASPAAAAAFDSYAQPAFDPPQFDPGQNVYPSTGADQVYYASTGPGQGYYASTGPDQGYCASTGPDQVYYATPSPEPAAYPSPDGSDDLGESTLVYPGSPPSLPKPRPPPGPERKKTKEETIKKGKKKGSRKEELATVMSWRDPADMPLAQGGMASGYPTYQFNNSLGIVDASGYQARSPYPLSISDADAYGTTDTVGPSDQDNRYYPHQQLGEEGWDMCHDAKRY